MRSQTCSYQAPLSKKLVLSDRGFDTKKQEPRRDL